MVAAVTQIVLIKVQCLYIGYSVPSSTLVGCGTENIQSFGDSGF